MGKLGDYDDYALAGMLEKNNDDVQACVDSIEKKPKKLRFSDAVEDASADVPAKNVNDNEQVINMNNTASSSDDGISIEEDYKVKYSVFAVRALKLRLKEFTNEYIDADDETICHLLDIGNGDVDLTIENLRGTFSNSGFIPPVPSLKTAYISDPNLPWNQNPTKPIPNEGKEELTKEGRAVANVTQLPYDSLEHIFEFLQRKDVLVTSSVNQYFNKVAGSDYFWTAKQEKGKCGLIENIEIERYNTFTKNQTHYGKWNLLRLDNLFYTKTKTPPNVSERRDTSSDDSTIVELVDDGRIPFKQKYAEYRKQKLIRERVVTIEKKLIEAKRNEKISSGYEFGERAARSWIGFFVILALSAIVGLILVPLSMDEFIPNEIGTYYWLISWLSLGILTIPYFYIMLVHHSHFYEFYPIWSKAQLSGQTKMDSSTELFILFASTWTWLPFIFLVAGFKYALYPELPILSYIAIPGYCLAMVSFFCSAPTLGSTLMSSTKERAAFFVSSSCYGLMMLSLQVFLILLFAKIDGLEYALNIPFSIVFIPGYISLLCFPLGFFFTAFIAMLLGSDGWCGSIGAGLGFATLVSLIMSPLFITAPFVAAVLDSFILQSVFPFVALFSITYGLGIIILSLAATVGCCILFMSRDYD